MITKGEGGVLSAQSGTCRPIQSSETNKLKIQLKFDSRMNIERLLKASLVVYRVTASEILYSENLNLKLNIFYLKSYGQ